MVVYKDILGKLRDAGYSSHRIRELQIIGEGTVQSIREGKPVTLKTMDILCQLLHCKIEDLVEIVPDEEIPFTDR